MALQISQFCITLHCAEAIEQQMIMQINLNFLVGFEIFIDFSVFVI
jgi:hypothetical protein